MPEWLNVMLYWIGVASSIVGIIGFIISINSSIKSNKNKNEINKLKNALFSKFELDKSRNNISDDLEKISQGIYSDVDTIQRFNSEIMMINSLGIELTNADEKILVEATKCVKSCISNNSHFPSDIQQIKSYAQALKFIIGKVRYK